MPLQNRASMKWNYFYILSLPLASCLFSQKYVFTVEVLLKTAFSELRCKGYIRTEVLICILKRTQIISEYCRKEVHLVQKVDFLKPLKSLVLAFAHGHMYLCVSGPCTTVWTSFTVEVLSPTGIQQWIGWLCLCFFIFSNAWRWSMYVMYNWYNLGS